MEGNNFIWAWLLGGLLIIGSLLQWRFPKPRTTFGSAAWLTIFLAMRFGLFDRKGLIVGDWPGQLPVHYDGTHAITYGAAGSGKGTSVIIPNLLSNRFIFLNDPGGENTAVAIRQWREQGFDVYVINPFGLHTGAPWSLPAHAFNPFAFLDPNSATFIADAKVVAKLILARTGQETGSSRFFMDRAETVLHAFIVHLMTAARPERRHAGTLYEYAYLSAEQWEKLIAAMKRNRCELVSSTAHMLERTETQSPGEFSGILSSVQEAVQAFADPLTRAALRTNEVDFGALKGHGPDQAGAVIAVVLPIEYKETHKAIPRLAMQCAIWSLTRGALAREKVIFEIDEAASLGRIESLPQWFAELRKYRVQWSLHFQNVSQPQHLYKAEWQTLQGNAGLKRFVGIADLETAKEASALCGRATIAVRTQSARGGVSTSETSRELALADELLRMNRAWMLAIIDNLPPALLKKTPYWDRPELQGRYNPNPYFSGMKTASLLALATALKGKVLYGLAWALTPHRHAGKVYLAAAALLILRACGGS